MGNFSRDTFNKLKHYVGVRLQQGVPIVDADWNEQEDIRKYELRTFIKWFIGDGVPKGNDGFRIEPLGGEGGKILILTANPSESEVSSLLITQITGVAGGLGFPEENRSSVGSMESPARLRGSMTGPFLVIIHESTELTIGFQVNQSTEEIITLEFDKEPDPWAPIPFVYITAEEAANAINAKTDKLIASIGSGNDFFIQGGDGTTDGAGRCLVDGWDVINENKIRYTEQALYENADLAANWGVDVLEPLTTAEEAVDDRIDTIYLDVWEREVNATEDPDHLVNPSIGIETAVRLKREWVVRVAEGKGQPPAPPEGHSFYPLARWTRPAGQATTRPRNQIDLRRTGVSILSDAARKQSEQMMAQIMADAFGLSYRLNPDGEPNLKVNLRDAINAILRGALPSSTEVWLTYFPNTAHVVYPTPFPSGVTLPQTWPSGVLNISTTRYFRPTSNWLFWTVNGGDIWYKRYNYDSERWDGDVQLPATNARNDEIHPVFGQGGNLWLFWRLNSGGIASKRYIQERNEWEDAIHLDDSGNQLSVVSGNYGIWAFWQNNNAIFFKQYLHRNQNWENSQSLSDDGQNSHPFALVTRFDNLWVFWQSDRSGNYEIWGKFTGRGVNNWEQDVRITTNSGTDEYPFAVEDRRDRIWLFWLSNRSGQRNIWYKHSIGSGNNVTWSNPINLTGDVATNIGTDFFAFGDRDGDIWVFWSASGVIWYKRYNLISGWGPATQFTSGTEHETAPRVVQGNDGDIWVFWRKLSETSKLTGTVPAPDPPNHVFPRYQISSQIRIAHKKLVPRI